MDLRRNIMDEQSNGVCIEGVDWRELFPALRLFGAFRMAVQPAKLLLALAFLLLVGGVGCVVDLTFSNHLVYPGERAHLAHLLDHRRDPTSGETPLGLPAWRREARQKTRRNVEELLWQAGVEGDMEGLLEGRSLFSAASAAVHESFAQRYDKAVKEAEEAESSDATALRKTLAALRQQRRAALAILASQRPRGIFAETMAFERAQIGELAVAAATFNLGWRQWPAVLSGPLPSESDATPSVLTVLRRLLVDHPRWLMQAHFWPALVMTVAAAILWALFGGAMARLAAVQATRGTSCSLLDALRFGGRKFLWMLLAPVMPLLFALLVAALLALGGMLANVWVLDILAALFYGVALVGGLVIALVVIGLLAGQNLLLPAIAVEGTDAFDAISRIYNYALGRPWRTILYNGVALIYGALTYLFVAALLLFAITAARGAVGWGHVTGDYGMPVFDAMVPLPTMHGDGGVIDWSLLGWSARFAAVLVAGWHWLALGLLLAFAISFYVSASTWVYLLLRRSADASDFDDVWLHDEPEQNSAPAVASEADQGTDPAPAATE